MVQVVHLGIRKTGTSTFQRTLQRAQDSGVNIIHGKKSLQKWGNNNPAKKPQDIDFSELEQIFRSGQDRHAIFSYEGLATYDQFVLAGIIKKTLPDARILVSIRGPDSFLRSQYKHHMHNGGFKSAEQFADQYCRGKLSHLLDVETLTKAYDSVGLSNQLTIIPYEWQRDNYDSYLEFMSAFCELDLRKHLPDYQVNKSPDLRFLELVRRFNQTLAAAAPELLKQEEYGTLIRMASMSTAQTPELNYIFEEYYDKLGIEFSPPKVPADLWPDFVAKLQPLRRLERFKPYLSEYGLEPMESDHV